MSQEQAAILRDELEQQSRRRKRRRYPAELRERASEYAREVRAAGGTLADAAEALGLRRATLRNWVLGRGAVVPARGLRRVEVVRSSEPVDRASKLIVTSPRGLRIEGLGVIELARLIEWVG